MSENNAEREAQSVGPTQVPPADPSASDPGHLLLTFLRLHDAHCPLCGYDLRGLTAPRCPECGEPLRLTVGLVEPALRSWITSVISLSLTAGIGAIVSIVFLRIATQPYFRFRWPDRFPEQVLMASAMYCAFSILPAGVVILLRRRFVRLPRGVQRRIAIAATLMTALAFLGFILALVLER